MTDTRWFRLKVCYHDEKDFHDDNDVQYLLKRLFSEYSSVNYREVVHYDTRRYHKTAREFQARREIITCRMGEDGNFYRDENGDVNVLVPREKPFLDTEFFEKNFHLSKVLEVSFDGEFYTIISEDRFYLFELDMDMLMGVCFARYGGVIEFYNDTGRLNKEEREEYEDNEFEDYYVLRIDFNL